MSLTGYSSDGEAQRIRIRIKSLRALVDSLESCLDRGVYVDATAAAMVECAVAIAMTCARYTVCTRNG